MIKAFIIFIAVVRTWFEVICTPIEVIIDIISTYFVLRYFVWDYLFNNKEFWEFWTMEPNALVIFLIVGFFSSRLIGTILRSANKEL